MNEIGIIGAGSYGTALAQCFSPNLKKIIMISDLMEVHDSINRQHVNSRFCPYVMLDQNIGCSMNINSLEKSELIFLAVPSEAIKEVCEEIRDKGLKAPLVICSKGVDIEKGRLLSQLVQEICKDNKIAVLSGPSFANEIAKGMKAGVNIASDDKKLAMKIAKALSTVSFKLETIGDPIGLQIAGAFKNMLAVGCGIYRGLGYGESTVAMIMVDAIKEMSDLAVKMGGKRETFLEYGGIGDIILTCNSMQSRNVLFGKYIASGGMTKNWQGPLAEGARSVKAIPMFEKNYDVELNIFHDIFERVYPKKR